MIGEAGNPQNALSLTPQPSDHRGVLTIVDVTPIPTPVLIPTPALISAEPGHVREGDNVLISIASPDCGHSSATGQKRGKTTP